jgi:hypothetical protein
VSFIRAGLPRMAKGIVMTADLPAPPAAATGQAAPGMFAGVDMCLLCVLLVVCPPAGIA